MDRLIRKTAHSEVWLCNYNGKTAVRKMYPFSQSLLNVFIQLSAVRCNGLPEIYDISTDSGHVTVIEEYIAGENLSSERLSEKEIRRVGISLCETLEMLHKNRLIHRDIKPENIMLSGQRVVLTDFNAARFFDGNSTQDTRLLGTGGYAAPEQYGFSETDSRADIYALGVTLKELCGEKQGSLKRAISRCTEFDPKKRYKSASELKGDLKHPYRREITAAVIGGILIAAVATFFTLADVPRLFSDITGKTLYDADMKNPITVEYMLNQADMDYLKDGDGEIKFRYGHPLDKGLDAYLDYPEVQFIDYTMPETALIFRVSEDTDASVLNPKVHFKLNNILLQGMGYSEGITLGGHLNGVGYYTEAEWSGTSLNGEDSFILDFKRAIVYGENPNIEVTVSVDGFEDKVFTIEINKGEYTYPFSEKESFDYIFDCPPLIGVDVNYLLNVRKADYTVTPYDDGKYLVSFEDINVQMIVLSDTAEIDEYAPIVGLIFGEGVQLSGMSQIGSTAEEIADSIYGTLTMNETAETVDGDILTTGIMTIDDTEYTVYFRNGASYMAVLELK